MPAERVIGSSLPYGPDEPAISVVEVGWRKEGVSVEVATKCVRSDDGTDYLPKLEPIEVQPLTGPGIPQMGELLEAEGVGSSGHYIQLDRRGINDLIRKLRRARDQSFGRDE